jgi:hypothetical protein
VHEVTTDTQLCPILFFIVTVPSAGANAARVLSQKTEPKEPKEVCHKARLCLELASNPYMHTCSVTGG